MFLSLIAVIYPMFITLTSKIGVKGGHRFNKGVLPVEDQIAAVQQCCYCSTRKLKQESCSV
jgi:hypothetical protein